MQQHTCAHTHTHTHTQFTYEARLNIAGLRCRTSTIRSFFFWKQQQKNIIWEEKEQRGKGRNEDRTRGGENTAHTTHYHTHQIDIRIALPPPDGGGLLHERLWLPLPQLTEHPPHALHWPFTGTTDHMHMIKKTEKESKHWVLHSKRLHQSCQSSEWELHWWCMNMWSKQSQNCRNSTGGCCYRRTGCWRC